MQNIQEVNIQSQSERFDGSLNRNNSDLDDLSNLDSGRQIGKNYQQLCSENSPGIFHPLLHFNQSLFVLDRKNEQMNGKDHGESHYKPSCHSENEANILIIIKKGEIFFENLSKYFSLNLDQSIWIQIIEGAEKLNAILKKLKNAKDEKIQRKYLEMIEEFAKRMKKIQRDNFRKFKTKMLEDFKNEEGLEGIEANLKCAEILINLKDCFCLKFIGNFAQSKYLEWSFESAGKKVLESWFKGQLDELIPFLKTFRSTETIARQSQKMKNKMEYLKEMQNNNLQFPKIFREEIWKIIQNNQAIFQREAEEKLKEPLFKYISSNSDGDRQNFLKFHQRMCEFDGHLKFGENFLKIEKTMTKLFSDLKDLKPREKSEIERKHMALCYLKIEISKYEYYIDDVCCFLMELGKKTDQDVEIEIEIHENL